MNRKLLLLDLALAAAATFGGVELRNEARAAKAREAAKLQARTPPLPPPPFTPKPSPTVVMATGYAEIAQKDLLDKSRNPTVVVEPPPPPPPPPPMPPLPLFRGMMNIDGVTALMSVKAESPLEEVRPGAKIGEFKLVDVNAREIALEWNGKVIHKPLDEIIDRNAGAEQAPSRAAAPVANAIPALPARQEPLGPGLANPTGGSRPCQANDSNPAGTVIDNYRKVVTASLFGTTCYWEPVGR